MDLQLKGKNVVVTGGSKGIGYAIAEQFLREGARVTISARHQSQLEEAVAALAPLGEIRGFVSDGTVEEEMQALARFAAGEGGELAAWVNNIGTNRPRKGEGYTDEELNYLIAANFKATVFGSQAAFPWMRARGGSIVNIASLAARCATTGRSTIYAAMKSAVVAYSRTLAGEYAAYGVRVNAVLPGYTATPLVKGTFTQEALDELLQNNLVGRMADPSEIARPVVFLSSPAASYITAASLEVCGGHNEVLNPQYSFEKKRREEQ